MQIYNTTFTISIKDKYVAKKGKNENRLFHPLDINQVGDINFLKSYINQQGKKGDNSFLPGTPLINFVKMYQSSNGVYH